MYYWLHQPRTSMAAMPCEFRSFSAGLPGVECEVCGNIWATASEQIARELPESHLLRSLSMWPVSPSRLKALAQDVAHTLLLPDSQVLLPGTDIGLLNIQCNGETFQDFEWPGKHKIVINLKTYHVLLNRKLTGWRPSPVSVNGKINLSKEPPNHQLLVSGNAGIAQSTPAIEEVFHCLECGFIKYNDPILTNFTVNTKVWDGSDFFRFAPPFNGYIFVSHKTKCALEEEKLLNYELSTLPEFITHYNRLALPSAE